MTTLEQTLSKLTDKSEQGFYNAYEEFDWPDSLNPDSFWMSPELLSVHESEIEKCLDESQLQKLSQCEVIHFFSINIHGEKELVTSVTDAIYTPEFMDASRYFHHFIAEETVHMWFFSEFCRRYGGKIYPNLAIRFSVDEIVEDEVRNLITFSRIYIIERIIVFFNGIMQRDQRLHPILQKINKIHFSEESRHLAMGEIVIRNLVNSIGEKYGRERLRDVGEYLKNFTQHCVTSFYNPAVYRDAGFDDPYEVRRRLLADPARQKFNAMLFEQGIQYFPRLGVFDD